MKRLSLLVFLLLASCSAWQAGQNTSQLVDTINDIREKQVISNIARAIDNPAVVPSQVILSQGLASSQLSISPTFDFPMLKKDTTKTFNITGTDSWTSQWQMIPVSASSDLSKLRELYAFVVADFKPDTSEETVKKRMASFHHEMPGMRMMAKIDVSPSDRDVVDRLLTGESQGCKEFEATKAPTEFYHRWLYWNVNGAWQPFAPPQNETLTLLSTNLNKAIYTTSKECFYDFVLIVQSATPEAHDAAAAVPKPAISQ